MNPELSIIVPAYDEEENILSLINSLTNLIKTKKWNAEIIIVNDNSKDSTGRIAEEISKKNKYVQVVHRKKGNNGMGFALKDGTKKARGKYIIWTMADKSDSLDTYPRILEKLKQGYDMVFASRYMEGGSSGDLEGIKKFLSSGYTSMSKIIFGIKVHDITNAFRGFRKKIFEDIYLESGDFSIVPEFSIKAHKKGLRLVEVPTTYTMRKEGETKFKFIKMGIRYARLFKYKFTKN